MGAKTTQSVPETLRRGGVMLSGTRTVPEEMPIAFSIGGSSHAVMMATPDDLEDFAVGFLLNEGIIASPADIASLEAVPAGEGIDLQMTLAGDLTEEFRGRRRAKAGPVGCGLCGVESIDEALPEPRTVAGSSLSLSSQEIVEAVRLLDGRQPLHALTRAMHGAAFYVPDEGLLAMREDVGRHNALDKLVGALARAGVDPRRGAVVMTSRVSVELIQKAAAAGSPFIIAISAPTALAIRTAEKAGMTIIALVRGEEFEVFSHPERIREGATAHVA
ncbi:formate dehydrogenase accessory sulfurtransferase FdhD [Rhizobium sp. PAMB 3174]